LIQGYVLRGTASTHSLPARQPPISSLARRLQSEPDDLSGCGRVDWFTRGDHRPDLQHAAGVRRLSNASLQVNFNTVPLDDALASVRLFAERVMPHFTVGR
jgi:hypothetical protein